MRATKEVFATGWRTNAVRSREVQTVRRGGREYLQFPLVPLTEMVLNYPENGTREYLPAEHIEKSASLWDGTLLTYVHPKNRDKTVRDPDEWMSSVIGAFHDPQALDGGKKLRGNGLIDVAKAEALGGSAAELVELLRRGEQVSVSAGYVTMDDEYRSGHHEGEPYDLVQGNLLPDHIAVFPSDSRMRARCSPEDGCAAPRANAAQQQTEQGANQRATNGVNVNMSDTESDVSTTEEQRQMTDELVVMLDEVASSGVPTDAQAAGLQRLRAVTNGLANTLAENESADVGPALRAAIQESKALVADILNESTETTTEKTNAGACGCAGVCTCDRPFTSGSDETGASQPNMAVVPGRMSRDLDADRGRHRENVEDYPAGGRKAWERRQVGLSDTPAESDEYPAGGRSAWDQRNREAQAEAAQSAAETPLSAGARRSLTARQNTVEPSEWAEADYPLTAMRAQQERAAKRTRWEELKEIARRNDPNTVRNRRSS